MVLTAIIWFHASSVVSAKGRIQKIPALFTRMETVPHASSMVVKAASTEASSVTSQWTNRVRSPPSSAGLGILHVEVGGAGASGDEGIGHGAADAPAGAGDHRNSALESTEGRACGGVSLGQVCAVWVHLYRPGPSAARRHDISGRSATAYCGPAVRAAGSRTGVTEVPTGDTRDTEDLS